MNMLEAAKKRVRLLTEELPKFPSLLISADEVVPQGRFAEAQAEYLEPNQQQVDQLVEVRLLFLRFDQLGYIHCANSCM